jgi:hypothetical protein
MSRLLAVNSCIVMSFNSDIFIAAITRVCAGK